VSGEQSGSTPYEQFGGHQFFVDLVADFYQGVAQDEVLRPLYPEEDLGPAEDRLRMFFEQYWGGPTTYSELRGHPRLRQRHMPFVIDEVGRDRWLSHMRAALDARQLPPALDDEIWRYMLSAAQAMVNSHQNLGQMRSPGSLGVTPPSGSADRN
jgi:hemoglobin